MKVAVKAPEALCADPIISLHEYAIVTLQYWKRLLINVLSQFPNKEHDHGHAYLLEDKKSFQKRSGLPKANLPAIPDRPGKDDGTLSFQQYQFYLDIYNTHMDINHAAITFLMKLFPSGLVGLNVGYNQLPTNLMVRKAHDYLVSVDVEPSIDNKAAIKLQLTGYNMTYSPSAKGPTVFFQELKHIKFQLTQTNVDDTLTRLKLSDNVSRPFL